MPKVNIYYEKNPLYRVIYADGLIGGITPTNGVNLNFYSTRNTIPKSVSHELNQDGTLNEKGTISNDSKVGIIREIEFGVYMTKDSAHDIYKFLKKIFENDEKS